MSVDDVVDNLGYNKCDKCPHNITSHSADFEYSRIKRRMHVRLDCGLCKCSFNLEIT